jgi:hypothetical protein
VAEVVGAIAAGEDLEVVQEEYRLTHQQVLDALRFAATLLRTSRPRSKRQREVASSRSARLLTSDDASHSGGLGAALRGV